jgi:hypothetical protein
VITAASLVQTAGSGLTDLSGAVNTNGAAGVALTTNNIDVDGPITTTGNGAVTFTNAGALNLNADIGADGAVTQNGAGAVAIGGVGARSITTTNDNVSFATAVTLGAALSIDTGAGAGDITFASTLSGSQNVTLAAGTGDITFAGNVGATRLGALTISSADAVQFLGTGTQQAASLTINGSTATTFTGKLDLTGGATLAGAAGNVSFLDGLVAGAASTFANTGTLQIGDNAADTSSINTSLIHTAGPTVLGGTIASPTMTFAATTLSAGTTLNATSAVSFNNTVDGPGALTVNTAGVTTFSDNVGLATALASLATDAAGTTSIASGKTIRTSGAQSFGDPVSADNLTLISTGNGAITATRGTNDFTGQLSVSGGPTQITDTNSLDLGVFNIAGAIAIHAGDNIDVNGAMSSNNNQITLLAGQAPGMIGNTATEASDNIGAVTINAALNAGTGNVLIVTAGDATNSASQSDVTQGAAGAITANTLTVVTLKGAGGIGNGGANIILNTASPANDAAAINLFSCPASGCPIVPSAGETRANTAPFITAPNVNDVVGGAYAAGQIEYSDISGVNVSGIGTVNDFAIITAGTTTISSSGINANNLLFEATGLNSDIIIDLGADLLKINNNGTGSLRFVAGRDIHMLESSGTIGAAGAEFNHHLDFIAGRDILIEESIRQAAKNLLFAANQSGNSTVGADGSTVTFYQTLSGASSGTGSGVTLQGSHLVSTGGNVTVRGVDFSLLGGGADPNRSHTGQELIAAGAVNLLNSGVIKVRAGTSASTGLAGDPFGEGARLQGGTVNIGSASTPGSNPKLLLIEGGSNAVGVATSDVSNSALERQQANAVVHSDGDMNIYLSRATVAETDAALTVPGVPSGVASDNFSLIVRGGTAEANNTGSTPLVSTALGKLEAQKLVLETDGTILFQGGTADLKSANAAAAASARLIVQDEKTITTRSGGSVVLIGGTAKVDAALSAVWAPNSQAIAQLDPSKLTMTVDGILVLQGGKVTGPAGALASARIDAGDEINITVNGSKTYSYPGSGTLGPASFYMIGGSDSGFFDSNNVDLAGSLSYPQAFPITITLAGAFQRVFDSALASGVVQTGLTTFDDSLLSYVIFAANVETQVLHFRRGSSDSDEVGAPACK